MKEFFLKHFWHETWYQRAWHRSLSFLKIHFIPHEANNHLPRALRKEMLRIYAIVLVAVKVLLTVFLFVVYPSAGIFASKISDEVIVLANQSRLESGIGELKNNELLTKAAQAKADDMIAKGYFSHTSPNGDKPWVWLDGVNYPYYAAGENLAMDFSSGTSVHDAFMKSPGHRKNIMNPRYEDIGVAIAYGMIDGKETAVLVEYFGSVEKATAPSNLAAASVPKLADKYEKEITAPAPVAAPVVTPASAPTSASAPVPEVKPEEITVKGAAEPTAVTQTVSETPAGQQIREVEETNAPVVVAVPESNRARDLVNQVILVVNRFFYAFIIFLILALMLKIFIKIRIQHTQIIGYTLTLIFLVAVLALSNFHFVEKLVARAVEIV